jgi:hypothetical protein
MQRKRRVQIKKGDAGKDLKGAGERNKASKQESSRERKKQRAA